MCKKIEKGLVRPNYTILMKLESVLLSVVKGMRKPAAFVGDTMWSNYIRQF